MAKDKKNTSAEQPKSESQPPKNLPPDFKVTVELTVASVQNALSAFDLATKAGGIQVAAGLMPAAVAFSQILGKANEDYINLENSTK